MTVEIIDGAVLSGKQCYLSGPIEHGSGINWRIEPTKILEEVFKIKVFDPFEDPKQQWSSHLLEAREKNDYEKMAEIAKNFVSKDLSMVDRSDFLIGYLPYKVATTGTCHEIIYSNDAKKPTLLICPEGKAKIPLWYYGFVSHKTMFGSWDELYNYLREVNRGEHKNNRRWRLTYGLI